MCVPWQAYSCHFNLKIDVKALAQIGLLQSIWNVFPAFGNCPELLSMDSVIVSLNRFFKRLSLLFPGEYHSHQHVSPEGLLPLVI